MNLTSLKGPIPIDKGPITYSNSKLFFVYQVLPPSSMKPLDIEKNVSFLDDKKFNKVQNVARM